MDNQEVRKRRDDDLEKFTSTLQSSATVEPTVQHENDETDQPVIAATPSSHEEEINQLRTSIKKTPDGEVIIPQQDWLNKWSLVWINWILAPLMVICVIAGFIYLFRVLLRV